MSEDVVSALKDHLCRKTLQELRVLAKDVKGRLADLMRKADTADRMVEMAQIGAIQDDLLDEGSGICYITDEVRGVLHGLPEFSHAKEWNKKLMGVFHVYEFINLSHLWQG